jgi:tetratricopeptide (TPR) repeat protein
MANLMPPPDQMLSLLHLSPASIRSIASPWQRSAYQAICNWLTRFQPAPDASHLEQIQGCLEAMQLFCELDQWPQAETLLTLHLNTPIPAELHHQLFIWGYYRQQIQLYERFLHRSDALLDLVCLNGLGVAWEQLGNYPQAIAYHQQGLALAQQIGQLTTQGQTLGNLGNAYLSLGDIASAQHYYTRHLTVAQSNGDREAEGKALGNLGNLYRIQGDYPQALDLLTQRLQIAQTHGDVQGEENAWGNLGTVYLLQQDYAQAIDCQERSLALAQAIGHRAGEGRALGNLGAIFQAMQQPLTAIAYYEALHQISQEIGDREATETAIRQLGLLYAAAGEDAQALSWQQREFAIVKAKGDTLAAAALLLNLATATCNMGYIQQSMALHQELLVICQQMEVGDGEPLVLEAMALYGLVLIHHTQGEPDLLRICCDRLFAIQAEVAQPILERCRAVCHSFDWMPR